MERFFFAATLFIIALVGVLAATSHGDSLSLSERPPRAAAAAFTR